MGQDPWDRREQDFAERPVGTASRGIAASTVIAIVGVIAVLVIGTLLWAFGVFTSDIKGQGDAVKLKNEASNRIRAQEGFESLYAGIQAADRNIVITADSLKTRPGSLQLETELRGQRQICNSLISDYDKRARGFSTADFRDAELPQAIDLSNPATDCKE